MKDVLIAFGAMSAAAALAIWFIVSGWFNPEDRARRR